MGCSFRPAGGCGKRTEERCCENHADDTNGSPRRAAKAKENTAGVNRRPISTLYKYP
jgi:hypothetical protein